MQHSSSTATFGFPSQAGSHSQATGLLQPGQAIQINKHLVKVERYLSQGGYAHVYVVITSTPVNGTTKHVLKRIAVPDASALRGVQTEVEIMRMLKGHPNIVQFIDASWNKLSNDTYEVFILMEFCQGGGIIDMMNRRLRERLTEAEILQIFVDVCEGVAAMHNLEPPLMHRDLKIENILQSSSTIYKLCDFGSAASVSKPPSSALEIRQLEADLNKHTTLQYRSPEMIDLYSRRRIDEKSDVWALGVLLYKLCYYTTPFEEHGPLAILNVQYKTPAFPVYSRRMNELIGTMLREHGSQRPSIFEVLSAVHQLRGTKSQFSYENKAAKRQPLSAKASLELPVKPPMLSSSSTSFNSIATLQPTRRGQVPSLSSQKDRTMTFRGLLPSKTANATVSLSSDNQGKTPSSSISTAVGAAASVNRNTDAPSKMFKPALTPTTSSFMKRPAVSPASIFAELNKDAFSGLDGLDSNRAATGSSSRSLNEVIEEAKKETRPLPKPPPSPRSDTPGQMSLVDSTIATVEERFPSIEELDLRADNLIPPLDMRRAPSAPTSRFATPLSTQVTPPLMGGQYNGPTLPRLHDKGTTQWLARPQNEKLPAPSQAAKPPLQRKHRSSTLIRSPTSPTKDLIEPTSPPPQPTAGGRKSPQPKLHDANSRDVQQHSAPSNLALPSVQTYPSQAESMRASYSSSGESGPEEPVNAQKPPKSLRNRRKSSVHELVGLYDDRKRPDLTIKQGPTSRDAAYSGRSSVVASPSPSSATTSFQNLEARSPSTLHAPRPRPQSLLLSSGSSGQTKTSPVSPVPITTAEKFRPRRSSVSELVERYEPGSPSKIIESPHRDTGSRNLGHSTSPMKVATEAIPAFTSANQPQNSTKLAEMRIAAAAKSPPRKPAASLALLLKADKVQSPSVKLERSESPEKPFQGVGKLIQQWQQRSTNG